jgi:CRISPR-associated protein Csd2
LNDNYGHTKDTIKPQVDMYTVDGKDIILLAEDLELFWEALKNMFDVDRSAARGLMSAQKLIVFKHDSILGNAPANKLFELVKVEKVCDGAPRSFIDYSVTIDKENAPSNVTIEELI